METKGYQKNIKKLFLNQLYRKLGCLVAVGFQARPDGAVPEARIMRREAPVFAGLKDNVQLPAGLTPAPRISLKYGATKTYDYVQMEMIEMFGKKDDSLRSRPRR